MYARIVGGLEEQRPEKVPEVGPFTTRHLLSWSCQVARGMEYLASKKVTTHSFAPPSCPDRAW
jgi:hypothetical protein